MHSYSRAIPDTLNSNVDCIAVRTRLFQRSATQTDNQTQTMRRANLRNPVMPTHSQGYYGALQSSCVSCALKRSVAFLDTLGRLFFVDVFSLHRASFPLLAWFLTAHIFVFTWPKSIWFRFASADLRRKLSNAVVRSVLKYTVTGR